MHLTKNQDGFYWFDFFEGANQTITFYEQDSTYLVVIDATGYPVPKAGFKGFQLSLIKDITLEEHLHFETVRKYLELVGSKHNYCVDIGAYDGVTFSNTFELYQQGWSGLSAECSPEQFVKLAKVYREFPEVMTVNRPVTPANVIHLLKANQTPQDFDFLDVDIDGYDYFVLDAILKEYRPRLILAEINEKIPPPIKFSVNYDPDFSWKGFGDHFYGQSLSQVYELCKNYDYTLLALRDCVNVFLCPKEIEPNGLSPEEAYEEGYLSFPTPEHNKDIQILQELSPQEGVDYLNELFKQHKGKYTCQI